MKKLLLLAGLLTLVIAETHAQVTSAVAASINAIAEISGSATKDNGSFTFTTAAQLTDGITISDVFTLTAKSNKAYYITVKASAANFAGGDSGDPLSVGKLSVSTDGTNFLPLTASEQTLIGDGSNIGRGTHDYQIHYRMVPGYNAAPASDYTTTLTYTITAP